MPVFATSGTNLAKALVVLVVEDEPLLRYEVADALREAGYSVVECRSGEEAIALSKSRARIDVLLTDINLGGSISGWEVAERYRMDRPDGAVLYTSGNKIDPNRCCPDSMFFPKPYLHDDILSACERMRKR